MTSMSSISILSQSPNERRRSGRARNASVLSIRAEGVRQVGPRARTHGEILRRDLVLAGLDDGAQQRQRVGERAQFGEARSRLPSAEHS